MFVLLQGKYKECDRELNIWNVFEVKYFSSKRVPQIHFRTWYDIEHIQIHTSTTNIVLVYSLIVHSLQTIKHSAYLLFSYKLFAFIEFIFGFQKILYYGKNIFHETEILWFETMAGKCLLHINSGMKYPTDNPLTLLTLLGIPVTC